MLHWCKLNYWFSTNHYKIKSNQIPLIIFCMLDAYILDCLTDHSVCFMLFWTAIQLVVRKVGMTHCTLNGWFMSWGRPKAKKSVWVSEWDGFNKTINYPSIHQCHKAEWELWLIGHLFIDGILNIWVDNVLIIISVQPSGTSGTSGTCYNSNCVFFFSFAVLFESGWIWTPVQEIFLIQH
jgi:hypothetical protein